MSDTNKLIKNVALDVISLVTLWGIASSINSNNSGAYININTYKLCLYSPGYTNYIALGTSCILLCKYVNM
jgi:hypothetical protein